MLSEVEAPSPGWAEVAHIALATPRRDYASKICAASYLRLWPHERAAHTPAGVINACAALRKCFDLPGLPASNEMAERSRDGTRGKNVGSVDVQRAGRTPQSAVCLPYVHGNALEPILFVFHYQKREHADLKLLRNFPNEMNKCKIFVSRRSRRRACDERQGRHGDREQFGAKHARGPPRRC